MNEINSVLILGTEISEIDLEANKGMRKTGLGVFDGLKIYADSVVDTLFGE